LSVEKRNLGLRVVFATVGISLVVSNAYLVWEGSRLLRLESDLYKEAKVSFTVIKPISRKQLEPLSLNGPNEITSPNRTSVHLDFGKTCCPKADSFFSWRKEVEYKFEFLNKLSTQDSNYGMVGKKSERSTKHIRHDFERVGRHQVRRIAIFEGSQITATFEALLPLETIQWRKPTLFTFLAINHPLTVKPALVDISHLTGKIDEFFNQAIVGKRGPFYASSNVPEQVLASYEPAIADLTKASLAADAALSDPRCKESIARTENYNKQPVFKLLIDPDNTSIRLSEKSSIYCVGPLIIVFEKLSDSNSKTVKLLSLKGDLRRKVLIREDQQIGKRFSDLGRLVIDPESFVYEDNKLRWRYLGYPRLKPGDAMQVDPTAIKQIVVVEIAMGAEIE
jgi:hypothetical protein